MRILNKVHLPYYTVFGALVLGISRNPSLKDELFKMAILGFALTEAIALFALMMAVRCRKECNLNRLVHQNLCLYAEWLTNCVKQTHQDNSMPDANLIFTGIIK
jgi:hypothetical protein